MASVIIMKAVDFMGTNQSNYKNQTGIVSIVVVGVIAVILTLTVLSFSRITNRDLRQSLDRQLSTQAGYAVETGINDTVNKIKQAGLPDADQSTCAGGNQYVYGDPAGGTIGNNAKVTCVLIKGSNIIRVDNQAAGSTKVFAITNGYLINSFTFSWGGGSVAYTKNVSIPPTFQTAGNWTSVTTNTDGTKPAVLRVTIVPVTDDSTQTPANQWNTAAAIQSHARTYFLYPNSDSTSSEVGRVNYNANTNGAIVLGDCNRNNILDTPFNVFACNAIIGNLPGGNASGSGSLQPFAAPFKSTTGGVVPTSAWGVPNNGYYTTPLSSTYYLIVRPIYNDASYTIGASNGGSVATIPLNSGQVLIDVTAKSSDVLKRSQVRVNGNFSSGLNQALGDEFNPGYGLESADTICKLLLVPQDGSSATSGDVADTACSP